MADSKIEKWLRWCEGPIRDEVLTMHLHRDTFQRVGVIVQSHEDMPPSYFFRFLAHTYAATQVMAVRRQAEPTPRVRTLGRLIREIQADAQRVTRTFWLGLWSLDDRVYAERAWDEKYGGAVGDHLDPAVAERDLARLATEAGKVTDYVDQHLAHADARAQAQLPTFDELDAAIDLIGDMFKEYVHLLTASTYGTLVASLDHDWEAIFRRAWLPGGQSMARRLRDSPSP